MSKYGSFLGTYPCIMWIMKSKLIVKGNLPGNQSRLALSSIDLLSLLNKTLVKTKLF